MKWTIRPIHVLAPLLLVGVLAGCSSGEERQAKYYESARELFESGDYPKARLQVRNALQIDAAHPQSRYLLALMDEREQNWKEMFNNLRIAVELDPSYIDARIKLGQLYFRGQGYEAALEQADAVLALDADNADGHTLRGGVFFYQFDTAAAIEEANLALASEPGHVGAISVLTEVYKGEDPTLALAAIGEGLTLESDIVTLKQLKISVLEEQGDTDGVIEVYQELIAEYPENLFFHYRLVKFLEQEERIDEAEALLRDIVKATPDNLQLKLWLAEFIANQRNLELAATTAQEFIEKQPDIYELRFALGTIYTAQGQYEAAEGVYTEVIALDEDGADGLRARNELVKLQLARGETTSAQVLLDEIVAIEPENTEALIAQARLEMAQGEMSTAIVHLRTVVRNEPTSMQALLLLGQAHEAAGSADLALDNYRNALAVDPANAQAVIKVAGLLIAEGELAPANRLLEGFLVGNPTQPEASHLLAESYGRQGRWDDALGVANSLEGSELNKPLGSYLKGRLLYAQEDYAGSLAAFTQVLELEPSAVEALEYVTRSYLALDRQEEAFAYLIKHVENYPEQAHARELLGTMYMSTGQADEAIASYQAALAIAPERVTTLLGLARAIQATGDLQTTLDTYDKALALAPDNATFMTLKADILVAMEQFQQAADVYEAILAIDSRQKVAANNLAMLLVDRLPTEQGLQRALEITAGFEKTEIPTFWDTRGWVYYNLEDYESALPLQKRAVESTSVTNSFRYHLGMTYLKLNDTESAHAQLEASLEDGVEYYGSDVARGIVR